LTVYIDIDIDRWSPALLQEKEKGEMARLDSI